MTSRRLRISPRLLLLVPAAMVQAESARFELRSGELTATVSSQGAELQSVRENETGFEYVWQNPTGVWPRHAPVLFPIIGALEHEPVLEGASEALPFHGFAREASFAVERPDPQTLRLTLQSSPQTLQQYPYPFRLQIDYTLRQRELSVRARIANPGATVLPASIGFHPGFNLTLTDGSANAPTTLELRSPKPLIRLAKDPVSGLLTGERSIWASDSRILPIGPDFPPPAALVLETPGPVTAILRDTRTGRGVRLESPGTHLGIWRKPVAGATFLCLEPWWGTTDPQVPYRGFVAKPGLCLVSPGDSLEVSFRLVFQ